MSNYNIIMINNVYNKSFFVTEDNNIGLLYYSILDIVLASISFSLVVSGVLSQHDQ